MKDDLVSVIVPSYNRPNRTQRAIDSVAEQSYSPIELLVVDDGSSPPLAENISLPNEQLTNVELLTHNDNQGANVARNTGIKASSGEYLAFLDSDDEWAADKIHRQIKRLDSRRGKSASYTGVRNVDSQGRVNNIKRATYEGDISSALLRRNIIGTFSSILVSTDVVEKVGKTDPRLPCFQDWEWYVRLSQETKFAPVPDPLTIRHNEGGQISHDFDSKSEVAYPIMMEVLYEYAASDKEKKIAMSGLQYQIGYSALANEQYSTARRFFISSIKNHPSYLRPYAYLLVSGKHYKKVRKLKRKIIRAL